MKKIFLVLTLIYTQLVFAFPPIALKGQSGSSIYPTVHQAPYSQITDLGSSLGLIETGSENILVDPGMEAPGVTAWTCTSGTCTKTTTAGEFTSGTRALKVALSVQALNVSQSVSTTSGIQAQGVVGVAYKVPSAVTDFQICSLVAGSEQTCVPAASLIADNLFHSIEIPVTMTAGSTVGIKFKTTATYTQNVFFDAAYVKQGIGYQNLALDNVYSAKVSSAKVVSGKNVTGWINGNGSGTTGVTDLVIPAGIFSLTPNCQVSIDDINSTSAYLAKIDNANSSNILIRIRTLTAGGTATDLPFNILCQKQGNDYLAASSAVYSQASANYDWTSYTPTFTGMGTVSPATNACKHRRVGGDLEVACSVTTGTVTASLASITLPNSLTLDSARITATNTSGSAGQSFGYIQGTAGNQYSGAITATGTSTSLVYFGNTINGAGMLLPTNGSSGLSSTSLYAIYFKVPISGWSNAGYIVGSFAGYPNVPGYQGNVDTFSVSFGATANTVCSTANTLCAYNDQIGTGGGTITRGASAGLYTLNTTKTYAKLKCPASTIQRGAANSGIIEAPNSMQCSSCSSISFTTTVPAGAVADSFGTIQCMGQY